MTPPSQFPAVASPAGAFVSRFTSAQAEEARLLQCLGRIAMVHDLDTGLHAQRVALYAAAIARQMGLPRTLQEDLLKAAPLHDIGKVGIPGHILHKRDALTAEERLLMQRHTVLGHSILSEYPGRVLQLAAEIALHHHENMDGSGYPDGLAGERIPLCVRIVAVADTFDALTAVTTLGAVVRAGEEVMQILPTDSALVFEAKVAPADIGPVRAGLPVQVKADVYDYSIYGHLEGVVDYVSPDALTEQTRQGESVYYKVRVRITDQQLRGPRAKKIEVVPGMTGTAEIRTGEQTVMRYITKPLVKTMSESMTER